MKILTMLYRWSTFRCIYCGTKKKDCPIGRFGFYTYCCPTDMYNYKQTSDGCSSTKRFVNPKEAKKFKKL